jgi:hypothetical protein
MDFPSERASCGREKWTPRRVFPPGENTVTGEAEIPWKSASNRRAGSDFAPISVARIPSPELDRTGISD